MGGIACTQLAAGHLVLPVGATCSCPGSPATHHRAPPGLVLGQVPDPGAQGNQRGRHQPARLLKWLSKPVGGSSRCTGAEQGLAPGQQLDASAAHVQVSSTGQWAGRGWAWAGNPPSLQSNRDPTTHQPPPLQPTHLSGAKPTRCSSSGVMCPAKMQAFIIFTWPTHTRAGSKSRSGWSRHFDPCRHGHELLGGRQLFGIPAVACPTSCTPPCERTGNISSQLRAACHGQPQEALPAAYAAADKRRHRGVAEGSWPAGHRVYQPAQAVPAPCQDALAVPKGHATPACAARRRLVIIAHPPGPALQQAAGGRRRQQSKGGLFWDLRGWH